MMIVLSSLQKTGIKDIIPLTDCYTFLSLPVQRIWLYINVSLRENFTYFPCSLLPCSGIANRLLNTFLKVLFKMNSKWISTFCTEVHINNKSHLELHSYHRLKPLIGISPEDNKINILYGIWNISLVKSCFISTSCFLFVQHIYQRTQVLRIAWDLRPKLLLYLLKFFLCHFHCHFHYHPPPFHHRHHHHFLHLLNFLFYNHRQFSQFVLHCRHQNHHPYHYHHALPHHHDHHYRHFCHYHQL